MPTLQNYRTRNNTCSSTMKKPSIIRRVTNCEYNPQYERVELFDDQDQVVGPIRFRRVRNDEPMPMPRKTIGPFWAAANVACLTLNVLIFSAMFLGGN